VAAASLKVAGSVVDQHCGRCHSLDRVHMTAETPEEWRATVTRMEQLRSRLKNLQHHVVLSQFHAEWSGSRGHVGSEFIENTVRDISSPEFFLCGPPPFMEASRGIKRNVSNRTVLAALFQRAPNRMFWHRRRAWWWSWRQPRSAALAYLHPTGTGSVEPVRRS
jgi:ferredoxin-NADP reductase